MNYCISKTRGVKNPNIIFDNKSEEMELKEKR